MAEVSHDDILQRVEATEKEIAILDTKMNRMTKDMGRLFLAVEENGRIARETKTAIQTSGRLILLAIAVLGVIFTILTYVEIA